MTNHFILEEVDDRRQDNSIYNKSDVTQGAKYESLKEAIMNQDKGTIRWLLNEGCPVNCSNLDQESDSALHLAVYKNDIDTVRSLISSGAGLNVFNSNKQTALHVAFEMEDRVDIVDLLLDICDGSINPFTTYGLSHFHIACIRNNWRVVHSFLENGVTPNILLEKCLYSRNYVYHRPLHLAVAFESFEVAELLLKYGANVNAKDRFKRTPLHWACHYNYYKICEAFKGNDIETQEDVMKLLTDENYQVDIVRLLLRYGADIEALDVNNTPPLFHLFANDYRPVKNAILSWQNIDESFWEKIMEVLKTIQREKFYVLLQRGTSAKFFNFSKDTLLHFVVKGKKYLKDYYFPELDNSDLEDEEKAEIADLLLKYGADVDAKNSTGRTPLQIAITSCSAKTVRVLLNYGAMVNNICFFHYVIPKKNSEASYLINMENFIDIICMVIKRKTDLNLNRSNELLILRQMATESNVEHFENCDISELRCLLDFGDINRMDTSFYVSEHSILNNREKISLISEHIQKLEIAGLYVDESIDRVFFKCNRTTDLNNQEFVDQCKNEVQKLKETMIDRYASFYDLLFLNENEIAVRATNEDFRKSIRKNCDNLNFFKNIIIKQFTKGLARSMLLGSAKDQLAIIIKLELPDPCSEKIISYLKNEDLCNLALAFEK